jgi:chemotaxis response regulator CheB
MTKLTIDSQDASLESRRRRDIIVIGASAAALNALPALLAALPAAAPMEDFVAVGGSFRNRDRLDLVRGRFSGLPVRYARDAEPVAWGQVLVAPPGHHLRLHSDRGEVARAPRRQPLDAAIDLLLHSAATSFADRVCALVLSSNPDEWNEGLLAVKTGGGLCALQDPRHSLWSEMPRGTAFRDVCWRASYRADESMGAFDGDRRSRQPAGAGGTRWTRCRVGGRSICLGRTSARAGAQPVSAMT